MQKVEIFESNNRSIAAEDVKQQVNQFLEKNMVTPVDITASECTSYDGQYTYKVVLIYELMPWS